MLFSPESGAVFGGAVVDDEGRGAEFSSSIEAALSSQGGSLGDAAIGGSLVDERRGAKFSSRPTFEATLSSQGGFEAALSSQGGGGGDAAFGGVGVGAGRGAKFSSRPTFEATLSSQRGFEAALPSPESLGDVAIGGVGVGAPIRTPPSAAAPSDPTLPSPGTLGDAIGSVVDLANSKMSLDEAAALSSIRPIISGASLATSEGRAGALGDAAEEAGVSSSSVHSTVEAPATLAPTYVWIRAGEPYVYARAGGDTSVPGQEGHTCEFEQERHTCGFEQERYVRAGAPYVCPKHER